MMRVRVNSSYIRCFSQTGFFRNTVRKPLSKKEIDELLSNPTWDVKELLKNSPKFGDRSASIDESVVNKLLQLSGLELSKDQKIDDLINLLRDQVRFLDHLHSAESTEISEKNQHSKPLSLQDLEMSILTQKSEHSKGEVVNSWDPLSLSAQKKNEFYVVKEGLIKKK